MGLIGPRVELCPGGGAKSRGGADAMTSRARRRRRLGVPEAAAVGGDGGPRTRDLGCSGSKALCPAGVGLRDNLGGPAGLAVPWPSPPLPSPATGKWGAPLASPDPARAARWGLLDAAWAAPPPPRPRALGRGVLGLPPVTVAEAPTDAGLHPPPPFAGLLLSPPTLAAGISHFPSPLPASDRSSVLDTAYVQGRPSPQAFLLGVPLGWCKEVRAAFD